MNHHPSQPTARSESPKRAFVAPRIEQHEKLARITLDIDTSTSMGF